VGGKNASLGEMIQNLGKLGVQVPGGFVVTVASYEAFIAHNVLDQKIRDIVAGLDVDDVENIRRTGLGGAHTDQERKVPRGDLERASGSAMMK
jgi:pyruvate,water dikinase